MNESMHLLTGAYAAAALDPAESADFEAHLDQCPECAAEVRSLLETTARLAAAEAVTPPARLKAAVMAQISTTRQLSPALDPAVDPALDPAGNAGANVGADPAVDTVWVDRADSGGGSDAVVLTMPRPRWNWAQRSVAVAAALLAVLAVGLSVLLAQSQASRSQLVATQQAVTKVLTASDARTVTRSVSAGGTATIVVSASAGTSVLLGSGLPQPPAGHTYELWYLGGPSKAPVAAGTFNPDVNGRTATVLTGTVSGASAIAVTVEPAGGSSAPTTKPVLAMPVPL